MKEAVSKKPKRPLHSRVVLRRFMAGGSIAEIADGCYLWPDEPMLCGFHEPTWPHDVIEEQLRKAILGKRKGKRRP